MRQGNIKYNGSSGLNQTDYKIAPIKPRKNFFMTIRHGETAS